MIHKRALLATEYFYPHWTGLAKTFYYVGHNLMNQGYDVTVLTTQFDKETPRQEVFEQMRIVRVPYQFRLSRTHYSLQILWVYLTMLARYDFVVINSPNSNVFFLTL